MRQLVRQILAPAAALLLAACSTSELAQTDESGGASTSSGGAVPPSTTELAMAPAAAMASDRGDVPMPRTLLTGKSTAGDMVAAAPAASAFRVAAASQLRADAMLIRTATAAVEVKDIDPAVDAARALAARFGGIVANAQVETGRTDQQRAMLQIRLPAHRFDSLITALGPLGRVQSVHVSAQDVGEEFVDLEARLANLRRMEARLIDLLTDRTGRLSDVLTVEREIARIRGEIEQIEGRRRYIASAAAVSSVQLSLHEPAPVLAGSAGRNPIVAAVREAGRQFVDTIAWCIATLGVLVPVAAILFGAAMLLRAIWRRTQHDVATPAAGEAPAR